jgi:uncharacterized OB-fold protein
MSAEQKPVPELTELNRPFFDAAAHGRLSIQRCVDCGHAWFPPARHCPTCLSDRVEWIDASGRATLWSWIRMHQKYFAGFADELPYLVGYVQLDEGPFMMSSIVDADPDALACDLALTVVFEKAWNGLVLPKFRPALAEEVS